MRGRIDTSEDGRRFFIHGSPKIIESILVHVPGSKPTKNGGAHVGASPSSAAYIVDALIGIDMEYDDEWLRFYKQWSDQTNAAEIARVATLEELPEFDSATTPWLHQAQAFHFLRGLPAGALFSDMGCGKSHTVVSLICNDEIPLTLIIGPLKAVEDGLWEREFNKHGYRNVDVFELSKSTAGTVKERAETISAITPRDVWSDNSTPLVYVINYECLDQKVMRDALLTTPWDFVVLDESHRIKAVTGVRSKFLGKLGRQIPRRLILTGTPNADKPIDVWGQFRFLEPTIFAGYGQFKRRYCITRLMPNGQGGFFEEILGYQNLEELSDRMSSISFRVTADVLDLPEVHDIIRHVSINEEAFRVYNRMEKEAVLVEDDTEVIADNILTKYLRLQEITSGYLRSDEPAEFLPDPNIEGGGLVKSPLRHVNRFDTSKADTVVEILDDIGPEEPVVIFYRFNQDALILHEWIQTKANKRHSFELSGRKNCLQAWKDTLAKGQVADLLVNIAAGAEAIDLTQARYCIYYSTSFSRQQNEQSRKRLHRPGQERPVTYYHLIVPNTVDQYIWDALQTKGHVAQQVEARLIAKHRGET